MVFSRPDFHDHLKGENSLILIKTSISVLLTFLNDESVSHVGEYEAMALEVPVAHFIT